MIRDWFEGYFDALDTRQRLEIINPVQTKVHKYLGNQVARQIAQFRCNSGCTHVERQRLRREAERDGAMVDAIVTTLLNTGVHGRANVSAGGRMNVIGGGQRW